MQSRNHCSFRETGEEKNHGIKLDASFEQSKLIAKEVHRPASYGIYIYIFFFRFYSALRQLYHRFFCSELFLFLFQKYWHSMWKLQTESFFYWIAIFHGLFFSYVCVCEWLQSGEKRIIIFIVAMVNSAWNYVFNFKHSIALTEFALFFFNAQFMDIFVCFRK